MKKLTAILISLLLLVLCGAAPAEENGKVTLGTLSINGAFTLQCGLPEGYRIYPTYVNRDLILASIRSEDPVAPVMQLAVAFDETYADVDRMNDLSEEDFAVLEKSFTDVDPTVEITYGDTGLGTRLLIARQYSEGMHYIDFLSIYKGYFVEFVLTPAPAAEDKTLTDEQLQMCIDFLTDLDFIPATAGAAEGEETELYGRTWIGNISEYDAESGTVKLELRHTVTLTPAEAEALQVGGVLQVGREQVDIRSLEKLEDGDTLINDEITLARYGDDVHVFFHETEYMEELATLTRTIPENLVLLDDIDPATGELLEQTAERNAAEFAALLADPAEADPGFASDNVFVTLDDNGEMILLQRFYTEAQ